MDFLGEELKRAVEEKIPDERGSLLHDVKELFQKTQDMIDTSLRTDEILDRCNEIKDAILVSLKTTKKENLQEERINLFKNAFSFANEMEFDNGLTVEMNINPQYLAAYWAKKEGKEGYQGDPQEIDIELNLNIGTFLTSNYLTLAHKEISPDGLLQNHDIEDSIGETTYPHLDEILEEMDTETLKDVEENLFYIENLKQKDLDSLVASVLDDYIGEVVSLIKETL